MAQNSKPKRESKQVSKWFHLDWQYVLRAGRLPAVKPIAALLVAFPAFGDLTAQLTVATPGFWLIWLGGITSLAAFEFTWIRCPPLIREYERFKDYEEVGHTHRWIGWLFYLNRERYVDAESILKETINKHLALPESSACVPTPLKDVFQEMRQPTPLSGYVILPPANIDRDLYIGFWKDGNFYVIALQEDDQKLEMKIKELFWIMATNLLSSRPISRFVVWSLYGLTLVLFLSALLMNLATPLDRLYDRIDKYLFG